MNELKILRGDCRKTLKQIEASTVQCVVTLQNMEHAADSGVMGKMKGEAHYARKLLAEDVFFIRSNSDLPSKSLANWFDVTSALIRKIRRGSIWKSL